MLNYTRPQNIKYDARSQIENINFSFKYIHSLPSSSLFVVWIFCLCVSDFFSYLFIILYAVILFAQFMHQFTLFCDTNKQTEESRRRKCEREVIFMQETKKKLVFGVKWSLIKKILSSKFVGAVLFCFSAAVFICVWKM